jgi:hypothetical protein
MPTLRRGGTYFRLADPGWIDPLDASYSRRTGGRWNPPGAFYLNDGVPTSRLQVLHKLAGLPYGPEDLDPSEQHDLITMEVPTLTHLDCISDDGLASVALPASYPRHRNGRPVTHATCQPIGQRAYQRQLAGVACRSAAANATPDNQELALFDRATGPHPTATERTPFAAWW